MPRTTWSAPHRFVVDNASRHFDRFAFEREFASAAARWAVDREADALLAMLADMPLVSPATLRDLVEGRLPSAVGYPGGKPGVPACFPAAMLPQLAALGGEEGAALLLRGRRDVRLVECDAEELRDVDRPEDLAEVAVILSSS